MHQKRVLSVSAGQQLLTDAAAGSADDGPAVGSTDRVSPAAGAAPLPHSNPSSRPSALHHDTRVSLDGKASHKHPADDRHVQIVEATSRNSALEPSLSQVRSSHMEQHLNHHSGVDLRNSLATWVENARSKLGMHGEDDAAKPLDKTTDNRGGPESTSDAISLQRDSMSTALQQNSSALSNSSMPMQWRGVDASKVPLERRDSVTSSVYMTIESPHNVARHLLEDLARMTKVRIHRRHCTSNVQTAAASNRLSGVT